MFCNDTILCVWRIWVLCFVLCAFLVLRACWVRWWVKWVLIWLWIYIIWVCSLVISVWSGVVCLGWTGLLLLCILIEVRIHKMWNWVLKFCLNLCILVEFLLGWWALWVCVKLVWRWVYLIVFVFYICFQNYWLISFHFFRFYSYELATTCTYIKVANVLISLFGISASLHIK